MKWAAMNTLGAGAWLAGVFYARAPQLEAVDGGHRMVAAAALAAIGAAILLWTNLRSAT